uniref:Acetylcholine receptor subunit alpha-type deg-3 n=1 Tax=Strongyloides venezuelensis TaxID=75913 RepID=A0A0K0FJJ0_STRVS
MNFLSTVLLYFKFFTILGTVDVSLASSSKEKWKQIPTQLRLVEDLLETYDKKSKPTWNNDDPVNVTFSMDLYQILELNEPQQYILLNAWIIESWYDEFLFWNPSAYDNISEIRLPHENIWLPDTTLYNSLVMKDDDTRRLLNAKLTTIPEKKAVHIQLLYPTIYKFSCLLNLKYFPFDTQVCTMVFSSWTYDKEGIDYYPKSENIGTTNYLENEGWYLIKATSKRIEKKYKCCPNKYAILHLTFFLRRKPLFYLVNLIIPTSIITLIALVGFFTTSSASGEREEKVSLGITTLLSMSILMLMVSDQMPTTSTFIPLIGWFILGMIIIISMGTLASSVIITVQKKGHIGERLSKEVVNILTILAKISFTYIPLHLQEGTPEYDEAPPLKLAYRTSAKLQRDLSSLNKLFEENSFYNKSQSCDINNDSMEKINLDKLSDEKNIDKFNKNFELHMNNYESVSKSTTMPIIDRNLSQCFNTSYVPFAESEITTERSDSNTLNTPNLNREKRDNITTLDAENLETFNKNLRISRRLAIKEYEWFATVLERLCFIIFVSFFFIITIGLNAVGYYFWNKEYHDILNGGNYTQKI